MRLLYKVITGLIVALGCLHIGFTPFNYSRFDMDAMWFVSAGVAIILAGFLNVAVIREAGKDPVVRTLCVITNASFALLFGVALFQLAQPQVLVGLALFGVAGVCALLTRSGSEKDSP
jgi:ABC-type Fe3+-siderophore transport system permease subunit